MSHWYYSSGWYDGSLAAKKLAKQELVTDLETFSAGHALLVHAFVVIVELAIFYVLHKSCLFLFSLPLRLR